MKMEQTECSETSAYKIQTPRIYPEESIEHSEQDKILKSINRYFFFAFFRNRYLRYNSLFDPHMQEGVNLYPWVYFERHYFTHQFRAYVYEISGASVGKSVAKCRLFPSKCKPAL